MKQLPREGEMNLSQIRSLEFQSFFTNDHLTSMNIQDLENEIDYDKDFRFTEVRSIDELTFAFTKKHSHS